MNTSPTSTYSTNVVAPPLPRARVRTDAKSWYRQFWPWFLIALPVSSVVFSFATLYIAVSGADEVVPHEGDSSSYAAPREPGGGAAVTTPADHGTSRSAPAEARSDDAASLDKPDPGAP